MEYIFTIDEAKLLTFLRANVSTNITSTSIRFIELRVITTAGVALTAAQLTLIVNGIASQLGVPAGSILVIMAQNVP